MVEAEIGKLAGIEDDVNVKEDDAMYTNPDEAEEFVKEQGVILLQLLLEQAMVHTNLRENQDLDMIS